MRFTGFDGQVVRVEFDRRQLMHMRVLERKKPMLEAALTQAFGAPVTLTMTTEEAEAQKNLSDVARQVINESYDVFGRDKIDITD